MVTGNVTRTTFGKLLQFVLNVFTVRPLLWQTKPSTASDKTHFDGRTQTIIKTKAKKKIKQLRSVD